MIVVSNTSPITNLAAVEQLDVLRLLYGAIIIPPAVLEELTGLPGQPGGAEVQSQEWIKRSRSADRERVASLLEDLHAGEAEAIALAVELNADLLLIDERAAREIATRLGLKVIGILGILVEAKNRGFIDSVKPIVDRLMREAGFRISESLYRMVIAAVGE